MLSFNIDFSVFCTCGKGLCDSSDTRVRNGYHELYIAPCPNCLADARDDSYNKGYDEGEKVRYGNGMEDEHE